MVGRKLISPLNATGQVMEPVVLVAKASGAKLAETATPDPDEDPYGSRTCKIQDSL